MVDDKRLEYLESIYQDKCCITQNDKDIQSIIKEVRRYRELEKKKNLIDKWEKRLAMLDKEYINNLRDKITIKEKKFNKHMKLISRINELEMCIKDFKLQV